VRDWKGWPHFTRFCSALAKEAFLSWLPISFTLTICKSIGNGLLLRAKLGVIDAIVEIHSTSALAGSSYGSRSLPSVTDCHWLRGFLVLFLRCQIQVLGPNAVRRQYLPNLVRIALSGRSLSQNLGIPYLARLEA
jgi:hypothetical protein